MALGSEMAGRKPPFRPLGHNPPMTAIVLTTLNARYAHASLGLRYPPPDPAIKGVKVV